jgi:hypothetical protein
MSPCFRLDLRSVVSLLGSFHSAHVSSSTAPRVCGSAGRFHLPACLPLPRVAVSLCRAASFLHPLSSPFGSDETIAPHFAKCVVQTSWVKPVKAIFQQPYVCRRYPSPQLGRHVTAFVKEVPIIEYPQQFVAENAKQVLEAGGSLFTGDGGGMRPWRLHELQMVGEAFQSRAFEGNEYKWVDVWQIDTAEPMGVLDTLKYTRFFSDSSMDRFDEFEMIARPLMEKYSGFVTKCCEFGVGISFLVSPSRDQSPPAAASQSHDRCSQIGRSYLHSSTLSPSAKTS